MRTFLFVLTAALVSARDGQKLEFHKSHTLPFPSAGIIRIPDSFGELEIEGWDREEVRIELTKRTFKRYDPAKEQKAIDHLERVDVRFDRHGEDDLSILTVLPDRSWKRPLRGESNLHLIYKIMAPRKSRLAVKHGIGSVTVNEIAGEMNITARIGQIEIIVPDTNVDYQVDAKVRIGDVSSDFSGNGQRRKLIGAAFHGYDQPVVGAKVLTLRLGIGWIGVRRSER